LEVLQAIVEGIAMYCSWGVKRIMGSNKKVTGVELIGCASVFDALGRFNPSFDETQKHLLEAEVIILAIGLLPNAAPFSAELHLNHTGTI